MTEKIRGLTRTHERRDTSVLWVQYTTMLALGGSDVCTAWIGIAGETAINENGRQLAGSEGMIQKQRSGVHTGDGNYV
ncbi:MAG: hypothetical protein WC294_03270 [Methanoregula sp.]